MGKTFCKGLAAVCLLFAVWTFQHVFMLPDRMVMLRDQPHTLPVFVRARATDDGFLFSEGASGTVTPTRTGDYTVDLALFGLFRKTTTVEVREPVSVLVGGETVGIKLHMAGVLVIGMSEIPGSGGRSPGRDAGIAVGDRIMAVNGVPLANADELERLVAESGGRALLLSIRHGEEAKEESVAPVYYADGESYKLGLWVRGSAAGIGTMTFVLPDSHCFAALGHAIEDTDAGTLVEVKDGTITHCDVVYITRGESGEPGELSGVFGTDFGTIEKNTANGLYGTVRSEPEGDTLPVGVNGQVKKGGAQLYSSAGSKTPKPYDIEIERVFRQNAPGGKNMVIHVTDERLLSLTGGIVQGMSGSPIVQDGKLVGAVTHVFVNDPTRGYGIFIENMLAEAEKDA